MERLLARQGEAAAQTAANQDEIKARQEKVEAEAKTRQEQLKGYIKRHTEVLLEGLRSRGKRMTACQVWSVACPEKSKTGPKETGVDADTFEERSNKMEATDLGAYPEATKAVVARQELLTREINFDNIVSLEDRQAKKRSYDSAGPRKLSAARKRLICRAAPPVQNGHIRKSPSKNSVPRGPSKGEMLAKKQRTHLDYNNGIKDRGARDETRQRMRRTTGQTGRPSGWKSNRQICCWPKRNE
jgi:hypothetical protein